MFFKNIQKKIISSFMYKKTKKECPVPLDISIKSNRKHHKTVLYSKSNKNMVGRLFGRFFIVFGRFYNRNIWSPCFQSSKLEPSRSIFLCTLQLSSLQ
jgi:hypothetical protein